MKKGDVDMSKKDYCLTVLMLLLIMVVTNSNQNMNYDKINTVVTIAAFFMSAFDEKDFRLGMLLHFMHRDLLFN